MAAEGLAKVFVEGVEVDVFEWFGILVVAVEFSAALGLADVNPVGGAVAGAGESPAFYEGLEKHGGVVVAGVPVVGQLFGGKGEYLGGEVSRAHPGQDEKAGVVDDEVEVLGALPGGPADEVVAWGDFPCGGAEAEGGQQLAVGAEDEVADLGAGKGLVSQVVMAFDQFVP